MAPTPTPTFLADLPDLVTPEILANKLGIKKQTVYQRIWRQKKKPESTLLPEITFIPGCNRVAFSRELVIEWWIGAQSKTPTSNQIKARKRGRPSIAEQMAGHLSPLSKVNSKQSI